MLLYIHGFNSSPLSEKAKLTSAFINKRYPQVNLQVPQIPSTPNGAKKLLEQLVETALNNNEPLAFIGSSLGGYLSTYLVNKYGGRAVLINPAVKPYALFTDFIGEQYNPYTEEQYQVLPEHLEQLKEMDVPAIKRPDRFFVLLQTGDETLDYREGLAKFHCCKMCLEAGGDHSFVGYASHLPEICQFLLLS